MILTKLEPAPTILTGEVTLEFIDKISANKVSSTNNILSPFQVGLLVIFAVLAKLVNCFWKGGKVAISRVQILLAGSTFFSFSPPFLLTELPLQFAPYRFNKFYLL